MNDIVIVDYGMANLRGVQKAFEKVGCAAIISGDLNRVAEADKMVLPGVEAAFRDAIATAARGRPGSPRRSWAHLHDRQAVLGVCLGLQLLFTTSYEDGVYRGLDYFPGEVVRFKDAHGLKRCRTWAGTTAVPSGPAAAGGHGAGLGRLLRPLHYYAARGEDIVAAEADYPTQEVSRRR